MDERTLHMKLYTIKYEIFHIPYYMWSRTLFNITYGAVHYLIFHMDERTIHMKLYTIKYELWSHTLINM